MAGQSSLSGLPLATMSAATDQQVSVTERLSVFDWADYLPHQLDSLDTPPTFPHQENLSIWV